MLLLLGAFAGAYAYDVSGTVTDAATHEPMVGALVRVVNPKDSADVGKAMTGLDGKFKITSIKKGKYVLSVGYVGYANCDKPIEVTGNLADLRLEMAADLEQLKQLEVVGVQTPIRVAEDTVEFNPNAFTTPPNAVVEDLLKRLPGVEVGSDGSITHNGKKISKILVDGQEYFSDDPTVASKNLPVQMVDRLQVVDRKSDLARLTGVDDGEDETVINLSVKKEMKNGWYGDIEAGYGTDGRYKGSFIINHMWDNNQLSIIGAGNNVNDMRFADGGAGFRRFGGSNGITVSQVLGVNFNLGKSDKFRVGGDVRYSHTRTSSHTELDRQYVFQNDSTSYYDSRSSSVNRGHNVNANFRVKWEADSANTFEFRPTFRANFNDSESSNSSNTWAGLPGGGRGAQVNSNRDQQLSRGSSYNASGRLIYNHNVLSHPGRSFSIYGQYTLSNTHEYGNTQALINYYLLDKDSLYDQYEDNHTWNNSVQARVSWTEPLGDPKKGHFLEAAYQFSYRWNNADRLTYDRPISLFDEAVRGILDPLPGDVLNDSLSNQFRNNYMNQDIRLGYKYVSKAHNLNVGLSLVPQMSRSINITNPEKTIPERTVLNLAPYMRYRWKMSNTRSMRVDYRGRSSQPSMNQLQPVADMSDPLNVVQGNPGLKPTFSHNLDLRLQDFNMEAQRSIMVNVRGSLTQNSIVQKTTFNPSTGGRYTTYENVNGVWNVNAFTMLSFPFRNKYWTFNNHFGGGFSHDVGFNNGARNASRNLQLFESPGIAFRPDNLELELRPTYRLQYTTNSVQTSANRTVHSYGGRFSATWYAPFGLIFNSDLNYTANTGYTQGYNQNEWMWNASISYQTLRNKSLTFTLEAHDILEQRSNIQQSVTASYMQDARYNSLTRYCMLTVAYKFNTFGKKKGQQQQWGPGGPDGEGGPMGPPPGGMPGGGRPGGMPGGGRPGGMPGGRPPM